MDWLAGESVAAVSGKTRRLDFPGGHDGGVALVDTSPWCATQALMEAPPGVDPPESRYEAAARASDVLWDAVDGVCATLAERMIVDGIVRGHSLRRISALLREAQRDGTIEADAPTGKSTVARQWATIRAKLAVKLVDGSE